MRTAHRGMTPATCELVRMKHLENNDQTIIDFHVPRVNQGQGPECIRTRA
jgi:hypothetical protein